MNKLATKEKILELIRDKLMRLLPSQQRVETELPGIVLSRYDSITTPENCLYYPMIALVVQGNKRAFYGNQEVNYGRGEYIILCSDMPGAFHVTQADHYSPFLSISLRLDPQIIIQLLTNNQYIIDYHENKGKTIAREIASDDLLLAFYRLIRLLDKPEYSDFMRPMIIKEIHYYILKSHLSEKLCLFSIPGTRDNRIAQAIIWLRNNFKEQMNMEDLARRVNMAPSTFNKYFKEITSLSPLQFQKHLRLYEAQRLLLMENLDARTAALAVGYESESQFSREYKRHFGQPPMRYVAKK